MDDDLFVFSDMEYDADHSTSEGDGGTNASIDERALYAVKKDSYEKEDTVPADGRHSCLSSIMIILGLVVFLVLLIGTIFGAIHWAFLLSFFVVYIVIFIVKEK